ncbi:hypothetical protein SmJEL517_g05724 [Synchytrium microbalum]|uniref:Uncharacterized protein n=1 Tax=Synchytrium microbalum TaxID=1806994 RepID=A0A507BV01_9FUNG|nr:uncharacterized protein SmJEL517_g05724 [Synchytrium microbalum]TPX30799.1 hypothetical protein SmJEL517_g05724 [Synchytrium microbalum]
MTSPTTGASNSTIDADAYGIFGRFRKLPEFASIQDEELLDVVSSPQPKAERARQRIIARLFTKLDVDSPQQLLDTRKNERRLEVKGNLPEGEKRNRELVFNGVFAKIVDRELQKQQYGRRRSASDLVNSKVDFLETMSFLLSKISGDAPRTNTATTKTLTRSASTPIQRPAEETSVKPNVPSSAGSTRASVVPSPSSSKPPSRKPSATKVDLPATAAKPPTTPVATVKRTPSVTAIPTATSPTRKEDLDAKVKMLEQELLDLRHSHDTLNASYTSLRSLYDTAVNTDATTPQTLDHRRSMLLKSQIAQLQRQVVSYRDSVLGRDTFMADAGQELRHVKDTLKSILNEPDHPASKTKSASNINNSSNDSRQQLLKGAIQALDTLQKQTGRQVKDRLDLQQPAPAALEFMSEFIHPDRRRDVKPVSLLDACSGQISHINLRHVGRLESQLHRLFHDLKSIEISLSTSFAPNVAPSLKEHVQTTLEGTEKSLISAMNSLLSVSVLIPMAPLPAIDQVVRTGFPTIPTIDETMAKLPTLNANQSARVNEVMTSLLTAVESYKRLHDEEKVAMESELQYHRSVYDSYTTGVGQAVSKLDSSKQDLIKEMKEVLIPITRLQTHMVSLLDGFTKEAIVSFLEDAEKGLSEVTSKVKAMTNEFGI